MSPPTVANPTAPSVAIPLGFPATVPDLPAFSDESAHIWSHCWIAAGVSEMIPGIGDVLPATIGDHGVHVLRGADGEMTAGYNALQQGSCWNIPAQCGNGGKVACAYVACGHSRDGDALRVGHGRDRVIRQLIGISPSRRHLVRFAQIGPVLFVGLPGHDLGPISNQVADCVNVLQSVSEGREFLTHFQTSHMSNWRVVTDHVFACLGAPAETEAMSVLVDGNSIMPELGHSHMDVWDEYSAFGEEEAVKIRLHRGVPNLVVAEVGAYAAIITTKPLSLTRAELAVALYGPKGMSESTSEEVIGRLESLWRRILSSSGSNRSRGESAFTKWANERYAVSQAAVG